MKGSRLVSGRPGGTDGSKAGADWLGGGLGVGGEAGGEGPTAREDESSTRLASTRPWSSRGSSSADTVMGGKGEGGAGAGADAAAGPTAASADGKKPGPKAVVSGPVLIRASGGGDAGTA